MAFAYFDNTKAQNEKILESLNKSISEGLWSKSPFLKSVVEELEHLRDEYASALQIGQYVKAQKRISIDEPLPDLKDDEQEVFIYIYNMEGDDFKRWTSLIRSLANAVITRPVYDSESDVRTLVNSKENILNEGYVRVFIQKQFILAQEEDPPIDRFGKILLRIRDNSLALDNILQFFHNSGEYRFKERQLIKV